VFQKTYYATHPDMMACASNEDLRDRYLVTGLFRPGEAAGRAGLMLLRPYEPDKIPVVMVHGLISSPLAWIPMLNELLRDDVRPGPFEANTSYILFAAGAVLMIWVTWWRPVQYKSEWELAT
jgi:hypothetical protein